MSDNPRPGLTPDQAESIRQRTVDWMSLFSLGQTEDTAGENAEPQTLLERRLASLEKIIELDEKILERTVEMAQLAKRRVDEVELTLAVFRELYEWKPLTNTVQ